MLEIKNITKKYNSDKFTALDNLNFTIPENSITGIIGPNGAGKSTLLNIITGFENCSNGKILYDNTELVSFGQKKDIFSYMSEELQIYPDYFVKDFTLFLEKATGYFDSSLFKTLQIDKIMDKRIRELSKGFHQRLKLYFALSNDNNKKVIVLDEPFNGFDPIQLMEILELIKAEKGKGKTFIISIHQLSDAEKICDYYILLNEGKLIVEGEMEKLKKIYGTDSKSLEEIFIKALK